MTREPWCGVLVRFHALTQCNGASSSRRASNSISAKATATVVATERTSLPSPSLTTFHCAAARSSTPRRLLIRLGVGRAFPRLLNQAGGVGVLRVEEQRLLGKGRSVVPVLVRDGVGSPAGLVIGVLDGERRLLCGLGAGRLILAVLVDLVDKGRGLSWLRGAYE